MSAGTPLPAAFIQVSTLETSSVVAELRPSAERPASLVRSRAPAAGCSRQARQNRNIPGMNQKSRPAPDTVPVRRDREPLGSCFLPVGFQAQATGPILGPVLGIAFRLAVELEPGIAVPGRRQISSLGLGIGATVLDRPVVEAPRQDQHAIVRERHWMVFLPAFRQKRREATSATALARASSEPSTPEHDARRADHLGEPELPHRVAASRRANAGKRLLLGGE